MAQLYDQIVALVAEERGVRSSRIRPETTLLGDLGCDGDDAYELLTGFAKQFSVDMTGFQFSRHFGGEQFWPWTPIVWLFRLFRSGSPESKAGLEPITVADLLRAAETRRWGGGSPADAVDGPASRGYDPVVERSPARRVGRYRL